MSDRVPTAVVTGAGRGLGRAISGELARRGYDVVVADVDASAARHVADEIRGRGVTCDVGDEFAVAGLAAAVDSVDVLVNNAGIWRSTSLDDATLDDVEAVLRTNVIGTWLVTRALVPKFGPEGGAVVNMTSVLGALGGSGRGIYPASKAALITLTRQMAVEYAPRALRVNAVGPGLVLTDGTADEFADPGLRDAVGAAMPLGRAGDVDDVAATVAFLASPEARYITGQTLYVDGGWGVNGSAFLDFAIRDYLVAGADAPSSTTPKGRS